VDYTSVLSARSRVIPPGVVIREVLPSSAAEKARLQPDTLITRVNGQAVNTPAEFYREMDRTVGPVELTVVGHDGGDERVTLEGK
jgi:S1-C subfamily serine protease